ncbi:MAG: peptide-methionine (S)-S-oxide reductase MsrA [Actinomycetota bacterium]
MEKEGKTNSYGSNEDNNGYESAVIGGGCFWCLEAIFEQLKGVKEVVSGYAGGSVENPTYSQVCSGNTGHAEVIRVTYDPKIIGYRKLLEVFFYIHDPTTLNRQGNDVGEQYRSIILFNGLQQEEIAKELISKLEEQNVYEDKIVTELKPLETFYMAEDYHQDYYEKNPSQGYCQVVISPKLGKFQEKFSELLK